MRSIRVNFGAMCAPISEQLAEQGLTAKESDVVFWQRCADAVALLAIHDLITDAAKDRARKRLLNAMARSARIRDIPGVDAQPVATPPEG